MEKQVHLTRGCLVANWVLVNNKWLTLYRSLLHLSWRHAKRSTVMPDDVLLLARRSTTLVSNLHNIHDAWLLPRQNTADLHETLAKISSTVQFSAVSILRDAMFFF